MTGVLKQGRAAGVLKALGAHRDAFQASRLGISSLLQKPRLIAGARGRRAEDAGHAPRRGAAGAAV